jgi:hypothetical protein
MVGQLRFSQVEQASDPPAPSDQAFGVRQGNEDVLWTWAQVKAAVSPLATASTPGQVQPDNITTFVDDAGVISAPASGAGVSLRSVTITEAEFAALNTNPILVVPPPTPDQALIVISATYSIVSGTGVYTSGGTGALVYGTIGGFQADTGDQSVPATAATKNKTAASHGTYANDFVVDNDELAGLPLVYGSGTPYLGGDLNMTITVLYYTVPCVPGSL